VSVVSADEVRAFILELLADPLAAVGRTAADVPDDFDLLLEGVIDSFGLLELVSGLGERYQFDLALDQLDPEQLTLVGPLARYIAERSEQGVHEL
jgi:acyl carrier protein